MLHKFTNNAVSALTTAIINTDTTIAVTAGTGIKFSLISADNGEVGLMKQLLTLTNATIPGDIEIVELTEHIQDLPDSAKVNRGAEGTTARAWPVGTVVSARITAGMLGSFVQKNGASNLPLDSIAIGRSAFARHSRTWSVAGCPVVQTGRKFLKNDGSIDFSGFGVQAILTTRDVDIGAPTLYNAANKYLSEGVIFADPANPLGNQYRVFFDSDGHESYSAHLPFTFPANPGDVVDITAGGAKIICQNAPTIAMLLTNPTGRMIIEEVGFICKYTEGVIVSAPRIKLEAGSSVIADNFDLTNLQAGSIHKFPISMPLNATSELFATVQSMGTGGSIVGVFYMRGLVLD